jgi:hypothetical protein
MPRLAQWELLGLLLNVGGAVFGIVYAAPALVTLTLTFRGATEVSSGPQASLGLAGLSLAALGSLAAIIVAQLRPPGENVGASLIIWANLMVLALGDILFYLGDTQGTVVLLFGLSTAVLTTIGLWIISSRSLGSGTH